MFHGLQNASTDVMVCDGARCGGIWILASGPCFPCIKHPDQRAPGDMNAPFLSLYTSTQRHSTFRPLNDTRQTGLSSYAPCNKMHMARVTTERCWSTLPMRTEIRDARTRTTGVRQERVIWTFRDIPQSGARMVGILPRILETSFLGG